MVSTGQQQSDYYVGSFGSSLGDVWPKESSFTNSDMTAIAIGYVKRMFAISADGRAASREPASNIAAHRFDTETAQKIFHTQTDYGNVVYGFMGVVGNGVDFDLIQEVGDFFRSTAPAKIKNLFELSERVGDHLASSFRRAQEDGRYPKYYESENGRIVRMWIVGFFRKKHPSWAEIGIRHTNQVLGDPEIKFENVYDGFRKASGHGPLGEAIFNDRNSQLEKYFVDFRADSPVDDAIRWTKEYVDSHSDATAIQLFPLAAEIGGHTHVAILADSGFDWVVPPMAGCRNYAP